MTIPSVPGSVADVLDNSEQVEANNQFRAHTSLVIRALLALVGDEDHVGKVSIDELDNILAGFIDIPDFTAFSAIHTIIKQIESDTEDSVEKLNYYMMPSIIWTTIETSNDIKINNYTDIFFVSTGEDEEYVLLSEATAQALDIVEQVREAENCFFLPDWIESFQKKLNTAFTPFPLL